MSSPGADADPAQPPPRQGPARPRRVSHLRAVQSPEDAASPADPGALASPRPVGPAPSPAPAPVPATAPVRGANSAYVIVMVIVGSGVIATAVAPTHWLRGVLVIGAGIAIGAIARAVLPPSRAGLLAVRGRVFDVICLGALAVLIVTVGFLIPR